MWNSFFETWTTVLTLHTLQTITLVKWLSCQKCAVIICKRIKNSQTKCIKDEWYRSNIVFDTIFLKQISPFTQSMVLWDLRTSVSEDKIIYTMEKKHTKFVLANYVSFSNAQNIFSLKKFLQFFFIIIFFYEWETTNIYTLVNWHTIQE